MAGIINDFPPYARDTVVEVNLDAIAHNVSAFRRHLPAGTEIMAVVKADAYGHGAIPVAREALAAGATRIGVAFVDEGIQLRRAGITAPVLVLGYTPPRAAEYALAHDLTLTVYSEESLEAVEQAAARLGTRAKIHVKTDTGMGRIGLKPGEVLPFVRKALACAHVEVEGLYSHFATADERDTAYARRQEREFAGIVEEMNREGIRIPVLHLANSAGAIAFPEGANSLIRLGISMYGFYPSAEVNRESVALMPALSFKTRIVHLHRPAEGTGISYGRTYIARGDETIAVIPVGYADGFNRLLSNRGFALVRGRRVPVAGRVCMDQTMLDVSSVMPVNVGDEVVLYGVQGDERITVDEVASLLGTIHYEVTCMLGARVPRIYMKNGKPVHIVNRLTQHPSKPLDLA
ncbi:alanine racemase [Staphylospora marina]|uniref:alanine racemase n=1 Tax=Staphylospora marina TaxID=2490858 RepID=UPI001F14BC33|nr:alanine racemase [Staphylospora marina]